MITVISATNRKDSYTTKYAQHIIELLQASNAESQYFSLENLPVDILHGGMYGINGQSSALRDLQEKYIIDAKKMLFVLPEYNGSYPGILKLFLDACSVYKYEETFKNKKAAMIGVSSGRAGNLRGMDHLAGVLNYLGVVVLPNKLPISKCTLLLNEAGKIKDDETLTAIQKLIDEFLVF